MLKRTMLEKKRTSIRAKLKTLRETRKKLRADEAALQAQIDALAEDEDVPETVTAAVDELATQQEKNASAIEDLEQQLEAVENELTALEDVDDPDGSRSAGDPQQQRSAVPGAVISGKNFRSASGCFTSRGEMTAFYSRSDVKEFLQNVRAIGASGRRAVGGAELGIPTIMLDLMRQNLAQYSKLITRVRLKPVKGKARQNVTGKVPEGVWTEMIADLNELHFAFTQAEFDGYEVGGYIPIPNAYLSDSDINLGEEIMEMLLRAIGYALDKAIVYGKGPGSHMPVGIVTRLAQQSQPAYWGTNQGSWTDLHSSHIIKLNLATTTGTAFFQPVMSAMGKAEPDYSASGELTTICNRMTHMDIVGRGLAFDAAGALVAGMSDRFPVIGGDIVELDFIPDYEIITGFLDTYVLAEREGAYVAQSEHVFFLKNQTVFKGCARYDGQPVVGEAAVAINYNNTDVTTAIDFAPDYANAKLNVLICTAAASGSTAGKTVVTVSGSVSDSPTLKYAVASSASFHVGDKLPATGWTSLTSGTTEITAAAGAPITVVELDSTGSVISVGNVLSVPKAS